MSFAAYNNCTAVGIYAVKWNWYRTNLKDVNSTNIVRSVRRFFSKRYLAR